MEKAALELESKFDDTEKRLDKVQNILRLIFTLYLYFKANKTWLLDIMQLIWGIGRSY